MIGTANTFPRTSNISQTINKVLLLGSEQGWNSICDELRQLFKTAFKRHISDMLLLLLEAEKDYDQASILLQKIRNYQVYFIQYKQLNLVSQVTSG